MYLNVIERSIGSARNNLGIRVYRSWFRVWNSKSYHNLSPLVTFSQLEGFSSF